MVSRGNTIARGDILSAPAGGAFPCQGRGAHSFLEKNPPHTPEEKHWGVSTRPRPQTTQRGGLRPSPLDSPPRSWTVFKRPSAASGGAWPAFPHLILWYYLHFPTILYNKGRMCRKAARKGACPLSRRVLPAGQSPSAPGKGRREDTAVHSWENRAWGTGPRAKPQAYAKEEPYT